MTKGKPTMGKSTSSDIWGNFSIVHGNNPLYFVKVPPNPNDRLEVSSKWCPEIIQLHRVGSRALQLFKATPNNESPKDVSEL